MSVRSGDSSSSWRKGIRNTDEDSAERVTWQKISFRSGMLFCIIMCFSPLWLFSNITLNIALLSPNPKPLFYGQTRTYHSIDPSSRHASFMWDKRIFPPWKGRRFSFLWGSSWAEFKNRLWQRYRKKVFGGGGGGVKWSLKRSEWWKSHKIWQDRFHQLKKPLEEVLALKEKHNSAHHTASGREFI